MKNNLPIHDLLDQETIDDNTSRMMSYEAMREVLCKSISKARGRDRIYLRLMLDILDLSCELAQGHNEEIEAEIYSILS